MESTVGEPSPLEPRDREDLVAPVNAEQIVQLGQLLYDLARVGGVELGLQPPTKPWRRNVAKFMVGLGEVAGQVLVVSGRVAGQRPDNWWSWSAFGTLWALVQDGFPVLWVPSADVLEALVRAPDRPGRQQLLLDRHDQVLAHAQSVLGEVTATDLKFDRSVAQEALDCVVRWPHVAQLGALTVAVNRALAETGVQKLAGLAKEAREATKKGLAIDVTDVRGALMLMAVAPALSQFYPERGDPVPSHPNRHAVTHAASEVQFTAGNALESVLLAVSVLRQAQANREGGRSASSVRGSE